MTGGAALAEMLRDAIVEIRAQADISSRPGQLDALHDAADRVELVRAALAGEETAP